jgi:peptide/nickel transport system substrate-binding protein
MADVNRPSWRKFQTLKVHRKKLSKRAKKIQTSTTRHAHKFIVGRWDNIRFVRRHVVGWLVLVGLLIGVVGLQLNWFQKSYRVDAAVAGGTYAEAVLGPVSTLNPLYASSSAETSVSRLLFSSLYSYDETGHLRGDVATTMTTNDKGTVYTVKLRQDARWQDGKKLTAGDVVYTVNLIKNPAVRSTITGWQDINAKALDDYTVEFTLPVTYASFPHALTFAIVPEHILGKSDPAALRESDFSQTPIGSGAFKLSYLQTLDTVAGRKIIHMIANNDYYRGEPKLARFQLHVYGTREAISQALRTSEVSAAADLTTAEARKVDPSRYDVVTKPINNGVYALFNTSNDILKDVTVRQALQAATDINALRSQLPSKVNKLDLPFVDGQLTGDVPAAPKPSLARAQELLDKAGWKMGTNGIRSKDGQPLKIRISSLKGVEYEKALDVLAGQWRKAGVSVEARVLDDGDASARLIQDYLQPRNFDVLIYELAIGADPDVYAYWHSSQATFTGLNFSNYNNGTADDALVSARSRVEPSLRNAKYISFAQQWLNDAPAIGLYQPAMYYVHSHDSQTITPDSLLVAPQDRYGNILYWTVNKGTVYKTP